MHMIDHPTAAAVGPGAARREACGAWATAVAAGPGEGMGRDGEDRLSVDISWGGVWEGLHQDIIQKPNILYKAPGKKY